MKRWARNLLGVAKKHGPAMLEGAHEVLRCEVSGKTMLGTVAVDAGAAALQALVGGKVSLATGAVAAEVLSGLPAAEFRKVEEAVREAKRLRAQRRAR